MDRCDNCSVPNRQSAARRQSFLLYLASTAVHAAGWAARQDLDASHVSHSSHVRCHSVCDTPDMLVLHCVASPHDLASLIGKANMVHRMQVLRWLGHSHMHHEGSTWVYSDLLRRRCAGFFRMMLAGRSDTALVGGDGAASARLSETHPDKCKPGRQHGARSSATLRLGRCPSCASFRRPCCGDNMPINRLRFPRPAAVR